MAAWPSDEGVLVSIEMPSPTAVGVRARPTGVLWVEMEGGKPKYLGLNWPDQEYQQLQDRIISWPPDDPDPVLIALWMADHADVVRVGGGERRFGNDESIYARRNSDSQSSRLRAQMPTLEFP